MFWGTISSAWKHRKVMVKHCGQLLTVLDDSACGQANFVKNYIGHAWLMLSLFEDLRCRSYKSILFYKPMNIVEL